MLTSSAQAQEHLGNGRKTSQDVHRAYEDLGLYIVCDGSPDPDGHWAAVAICDVIHEEIRRHGPQLQRYRQAPSRAERRLLEKAVHDAVEKACATIYQATFVSKTRGPSTSALDVLLFLGDCAVSAHVGNTATYLVRGGKALRLTRDHTYYEEMLATFPKGTLINPAFRKRLTRAIGDSESVPLVPATIPLMEGDVLVLCSNGLSDFLGGDGARLALISHGADRAGLAAQLVEWAYEQGSDDNITAIAVSVSSGPVAAQRMPIQSDSKKQLELLKKLEVFRGIRGDENALLRLQSILSFRHVLAGDTVVQQGSPSDEMFVVISGETEVKVDGQRVALRGPGEVIGEMGFFDRRLRSATITATQPTALMSIQRWDFDALVEQDPWLGYRILEAVTVALAGKLEEASAPRQ